MLSSSTENEIINNISSSPETISKRNYLENQKFKIHELINQSSQETSKTVNTNRIDEGHFQINLSSQRDIIDKEVLLTTSKYSFCIFIRMIPLISNFFPFIGHLYIVSSKGSTHDFDSSKFVDVKEIGPNNSSVGFSSLNKWFSNLIGSNLILIFSLFCFLLFTLIHS